LSIPKCGVVIIIKDEETKITEKIFLVGGDRLILRENKAACLIHFGDKAALMDAGWYGAGER